MQRPYVRQHVFLAGWGSFEASNFAFVLEGLSISFYMLFEENGGTNMSKAVGAGGGPGPDRLDRLVLKVVFVFACFYGSGTWRSETGPRVRLGGPGFADALVDGVQGICVSESSLHWDDLTKTGHWIATGQVLGKFM